MLYILFLGGLFVFFYFSYVLLGYRFPNSIIDNTITNNSNKYFLPIIISLIVCMFCLNLFIHLTRPLNHSTTISFELIEISDNSSQYIIESEDKYSFFYKGKNNAKFVSVNKSDVEISFTDDSNYVKEHTQYTYKDLNKFWQYFLVFGNKYSPLHITKPNKTYTIFIPENSIMQKE